VDKNEPSGFNSPADEFLPLGLSSIVAAQALFPLTSSVEMAGDLNENEVAGAVRRRADYGWDIIAQRVINTPAYFAHFSKAFDNVKQPTDISIVHIGNAIGEFISFEWRADNSAFDRYLRGEEMALSSRQKAGMELFYGKAECSSCHQGVLQTDHDFHALGLPQFGPGRTRKFDFKARDMGRINETDRSEDRYKFRTPSLRNVANTAPYGHNGAFATLDAMVAHHLDPVRSFERYDPSQLLLTDIDYLNRSDLLIWNDESEQKQLKRTAQQASPMLSEQEVQQLIRFLEALTDEDSIKGRLGIPTAVPSGLAIDIGSGE